MDPVTHSVELVGGHVEKTRDGGEVRHARVVFGHRITAKDLFVLDEDPQAQNPTQYADLLLRAAIVEFGTLKMPVPLTVLLNLDSIDREDLVEAQNIFSAISAADHAAEFLSDHNVKLGWGFNVNDVIYNRVQFGKRITGMTEVEADRIGLKSGVKRLCFLIGKQMGSIATDDGAAVIDGPIPLEYFESLDGADVATLRGAADLWRQSFRIAGAQLSRNGRGPLSAGAGTRDGMERGTDTRDAARTA